MVRSVAACCVWPTAHASQCVVNGNESAVFRFLSLVTLTFELGRDFCTMHLSAKFRHLTSNRSEVMMLTNKQTDELTDAAENIHLTPLCYTGG